VECCHPQAEWNRDTCMCEIACEAKGATCSDDDDCCDDLQCIKWHCGYHDACRHKKETCNPSHPCCKGLECKGGYCEPRKRPHKPGGGASPGDVDTFPSTGSGPDQDSAGSAGTWLAGGAAAAAAAWLIRDHDALSHEELDE